MDQRFTGLSNDIVRHQITNNWSQEFRVRSPTVTRDMTIRSRMPSNSFTFPLKLCTFWAKKNKSFPKIHIIIILWICFHFSHQIQYQLLGFFLFNSFFISIRKTNSVLKSQWFKFHVKRSKTFSSSSYFNISRKWWIDSIKVHDCQCRRTLAFSRSRHSRRRRTPLQLFCQSDSRSPIHLGGADSR